MWPTGIPGCSFWERSPPPDEGVMPRRRRSDLREAEHEATGRARPGPRTEVRRMKAERIPSELRPAADGGLKRNALSARQVAIIAIPATGPASVFALNFGPMGAFAGAAMVLAFVLTMAAILLLVNSFIAFSRQYVSAGGLYAWNVKAFGNNVGFLFGWFFAGSYIGVAAAGFAVFGRWGAQDFKQLVNVFVPWRLFAFAASLDVSRVA